VKKGSNVGRLSMGAKIVLLLISIFFPSLVWAQALTKIRVGYAGGTSLTGPPVVWATKEAGLFEKHGLEAELIGVAGGGLLSQTMVSGDIQFGVMAGSAPAAAHLAGADMVQLMGIINRPAYVLMSRPELRNLSGLKGKVVAVSRIGASSDFLTRMQLEKAGLAPDKDVAILAIGHSPERLAAVYGKRVDAALISHGEIFQARRLGLTLLSDFSQALAYPFYGLAALRRYIQQNEKEARGVVRAVTEAIHKMAADKNFTLSVLRKYARVSDAEVLENAYEALVRFQEKLPYPSEEAMRVVIEELSRRQPKAKGLSPGAFIDPRFVKELEDSGFIRKVSGG
jgi:ABC-type nitrate/sulfonate/bicarbonate transport system substrate-binding protein